MTATTTLGRSLGLKLLLVGALVLALGIPLGLVNMLAWERENRAQRVAIDVGAALGGAQTVRGPFLAIPVDTPRVTETGSGDTLVRRETIERQLIIISPDRLDVSARLETSTLRRAIYTVPVYRAVISLNGDFDLTGVSGLAPAGGTIAWDEARLMATVGDLRGISEDFQAEVSTQGGLLSFEPGLPLRSSNFNTGFSGEDIAANAVSAALTGLGEGARMTLEGQLVLTGARSFGVQPSGRETRARLTGDWPHPGFDGAYLPTDREISDSGFEADWLVPYLARGFPARWIEGQGHSLNQARDAVMTVNLVNPGDGYARVGRSLKYAFFFVGFTLLMFFLIESSSAQRLHAAQYILIGLAQVVFYLLLLALSEHAAIGVAFASASAATVALTALYAWTAFRDNARGLLTFAALTVGYIIQFLLVLVEDYALLIGSGLAFIAVAATMYVTRRVDWYGGADSQA
ncbi:cell envelope integrity protein CreD [Hyphomonadaceae bacterium ML37]|nr:cell envelope integrity protein CreD [Hyphomonadaceae bacterium ML37]